MNDSDKRIKRLIKENDDLYYETEQYRIKIEQSMYRKLSYKQKKEIKELEQIIQDNSDLVSDWFIKYWDILTEEAKSDAHLELGIDIDYEG